MKKLLFLALALNAGVCLAQPPDKDEKPCHGNGARACDDEDNLPLDSPLVLMGGAVVSVYLLKLRYEN